MNDDPAATRRTILQVVGLSVGAAALGSAADAASRGSAVGSHVSSGTASTTATDTPRSPPWTRTYDERPRDRGYAITGTDDGSLVVAGDTFSRNEGNDVWLFKVTRRGEVEWSRTYDGPDGAGEWPYDSAEAVVETRDGGFALAGTTRPDDGDNSPILVRTDAEGHRTTFATYETDHGVRGEDLLQTADGGFLLLGADVAIRTGPDGTEQWRTPLADDVDGTGTVRGVVSAHGGGYVVAGRVWNDDRSDVYLAHLGEDGQITSSNRIDLAREDDAEGIVRTGTGYAVGGNVRDRTSGSFPLLLHLDENLEREWHRTYGAGDGDKYGVMALTTTADGGFFLGGDGGDGDEGFWMVKTTASGEKVWRRTRSPADGGFLYDVAQTPAGDFVSAGFSRRDVSGTDPTDVAVVNLGPRPASETGTESASSTATETATGTTDDSDTGSGGSGDDGVTPTPTPTATSGDGGGDGEEDCEI